MWLLCFLCLNRRLINRLSWFLSYCGKLLLKTSEVLWALYLRVWDFWLVWLLVRSGILISREKGLLGTGFFVLQYLREIRISDLISRKDRLRIATWVKKVVYSATLINTRPNGRLLNISFSWSLPRFCVAYAWLRYRRHVHWRFHFRLVDWHVWIHVTSLPLKSDLHIFLATLVKSFWALSGRLLMVLLGHRVTSFAHLHIRMRIPLTIPILRLWAIISLEIFHPLLSNNRMGFHWFYIDVLFTIYFGLYDLKL
jgi:hypothetical protein